MNNQENKALKERVAKDLSDATLWTKLWSFVHHAFLFGGAVLSAAAAILLQLNISATENLITNLATLLAGAAALTITITGSGGFERKWRTNRLIKVRLMQLEIDLLNPEVEEANVRQDLKNIAQLRYDGIVGDKDPTKNGSG